MKETRTKCDACGREVEAGVTIRVPRKPASRWFPLFGGVWLELDLCDECWKGLDAVADAITLANRARGI